MHIHIPDGVFPAWLWISGIILLIPLLAIAVYFARKDQKKLVMASAISALMLIVFSTEVLGYHLNFTSLSGILLGPWWSLLSITIVNFFLAMFGHGGVTVAPINILINWVEALIGYGLFKLVITHIKGVKLKAAMTGVAVLIALTISFLLFLGVISLTHINPAKQLEPSQITQSATSIPLTEFIIISIIPYALGAVIECLLTSFIITFVYKVRPGMIG